MLAVASTVVAMLLQTVFIVVVFVGLVNGNQPPGNPQGSKVKTYSQSKSSSSMSHSSSSSTSYTSSSTTPVDSVEDKCDRNSTYKKCPMACPGTCGNPKGSPLCKKMCLEYGCECNPGYVVSENGKCVKLKDCPDYLRCNDCNAVYKTCPNPCPRTCDLPGERPCSKACVKEGCECKQGFFRDNNGKCVALQDCPDKCDRNSTYKKCPMACPGTCENPKGSPLCKKMCLEYGCECNPGYVVSENGKCVKLEDCPGYLRCNDCNAEYKKCPNPCPRTCDLPGERPCNKACVKEGCECKQGFYQDNNGKCVALQDCSGAKKCTANETFVFCNAGCPTDNCPEDDNQGIIACSPPYPCGSGCACKGDYLRNADNKCILYSDCPPINCTRPNEMYSARPPPCIFDDCNDIGKPNVCDRNYPSLPQCICKPGFYRNFDRVCVPKKKCPKPLPTCGPYEVAVKCKTICPPQSCEIAYTDYLCVDTPPCEPGCDCIPGYLRNTTELCIPSDLCPPAPTMPDCGENEDPSICKTVCPPQTCESLYTKYRCIENITCEFGCDCKEGFLRNKSGVCIPTKNCPNIFPAFCGLNEVYSDCKVVCPPQSCDSIFTSYLCSSEKACEPGCNCLDGHLRNGSNICVPSDQCFSDECDISPECRPTCANPEPNCRVVHLPFNVKGNQDGCKCKPGYILSDTNGSCIPIDTCPDTGCNGDLNSVVTTCPWPCPSTCGSPEAGSYGHTCDQVGCQCKPGFILSDDGGKCIDPDNCKCGNPCGVNGTFSECAFRCPNQYCPENDSPVKIACKPGRPCPSGCNCKPYYLRKSYDDESCVLASDCPEVNCTRPNEKWNPCASECLAERCEDLTIKQECYPDPQNCQPQCVCLDNYYRNNTGFCVPKEDCPIQCDVQQECRPTCAVPNPPNCPFIPPATTNIDRCNCESGYVLSKVGGKCIKIDQCPTDQTCNGDPNAFIKQCPLPCPSTCESPNAFPCKRKCDPIGCECKSGYLKAENGSCILPDQCKGGNPCGENERFTACRYQCPTNYCPTDDSRAVIVCETFPFSPCYSGCSCELNHKRLSIENPICVVSSDCPERNCTRPCEKWSRCPEDCFSEYCDAVDTPRGVCNTLVLNCNPRCKCIKGYFRNATDICVSANECRRLNKQKKISTTLIN